MNPLQTLIRFVLAGWLAWATSAYAVNPTLKEIEGAFIEIGRQVRPCVVNIAAERALPEGIEELHEDLQRFFRFFGQPLPDTPREQPRPRMRLPIASASGFIYDKLGHIVTNNHVVAEATDIKVHLWNGKTYSAAVVGRDPQTDVAVIKIDVEPDVELPTARLGDSNALEVGQFAIAVGTPHSLEGSLSFGHITALGRDRRDNIQLPRLRFYNFIQTDAAINLGNSGGPLCNISGEVIGMSVAIVWGAEALGFAIPINTAKEIIPVLIAEGKVTRGFLGVDIDDARTYAEADDLPDEAGAYVLRVLPDTPAERAGLQVYDVIRRVNGSPVQGAVDLQYKISALQPGQTAQLEVWRNGGAVEVVVHLEEFPQEYAEAPKGKAVLGLRVERVTSDIIEGLGLEPGTKGVLVVGVEPNSAAYDAGLQEYDVIMEIAKAPVTSPEEFQKTLADHAIPGKPILVRLVRRGGPPLIKTIRIPKEGLGE